MTEFNFESKKVEEFEVVSEFSMEDYEKYRLKSGELTIDVALVDIEDRDPEEYIKQRKNEISTSETEVPHPYKAEKQKSGQEENLVDFNEKMGSGLADPEYNLIPEDTSRIPRYDYVIKWNERESKDKLIEVELYSPKGDYSEDKLIEIVDSFHIETENKGI